MRSGPAGGISQGGEQGAGRQRSEQEAVLSASLLPSANNENSRLRATFYNQTPYKAADVPGQCGWCHPPRRAPSADPPHTAAQPSRPRREQQQALPPWQPPRPASPPPPEPAVEARQGQGGRSVGRQAVGAGAGTGGSAVPLDFKQASASVGRPLPTHNTRCCSR